MKVLIVANYNPKAGGISGQVTLLHKYLNSEKNVTADIFSTKGSAMERLKMFQTLPEVMRHYDVIHVHGCSYLGFFPVVLAVECAKKLGKRVVCTYHGGGAGKFFSTYKWIVRHYLSRTNANIVLSCFLAKIFDKHKIPYTIIPNIIRTEENVYRERKMLSPKFISIRTLDPLYNIECIIKAFAILKPKYPDATLDILADGPSRQKLMDLVRELGLSDITFIGRVHNSEIYNYLDKADIFLSTPHIDNQPMSVLEAFKCGLLVISTNVGGVPYLVEDNKTGLLINDDDHQELADKMEWALAHQEQALKMAEAGHGKLSEYTWDAIRSKIHDAYCK